MFVYNNRPSFHSWWKENLVKYQKASKYYETDCRPKKKKGRNRKRDTHESAYAFCEGRELTLNTFKSGTFPIKANQGKGLQIWTPKQMLQRLPTPIALGQTKAGNTSRNLLYEIRQTIYPLIWAKEITKKAFNNIMNSIKM